MTKTEQYKKNQKKSKLLNRLAPIVFWGLLAVAVFCLFLALRNSLGNLGEIIDLLDSRKYNETEVSEHYQMLIDRYGEWRIGAESGGMAILFINLKAAVFNGFATMTAIFSVVFLACAFLLGKWILPMRAKQIEQDNQDLVNLTILANK